MVDIIVSDTPEAQAERTARDFVTLVNDTLAKMNGTPARDHIPQLRFVSPLRRTARPKSGAVRCRRYTWLMRYGHRELTRAMFIRAELTRAGAIATATIGRASPRECGNGFPRADIAGNLVAGPWSSSPSTTTEIERKGNQSS